MTEQELFDSYTEALIDYQRAVLAYITRDWGYNYVLEMEAILKTKLDAYMDYRIKQLIPTVDDFKYSK